MYFDLQDYRPDPPRIPTAISVREGVLLSLVAHLVLVIAYLLTPASVFERTNRPVVVAQLERPQDPPLRFVEVMPAIDRMERPVRPADQSDMDRRSSTLETPRDAVDPMPFMRGNTPEMFEGGPVEPPTPDAGAASDAPPDVADQPVPSSAEMGVIPPQEPDRPQNRPIGDALRNLRQYLRQENFNNPTGGNTEQSAAIQFDSMGVDFGPWLRRFKNQVERNWLVPSAAMIERARVVVQFDILRNGTITDLRVIQPAANPALTNSALNALRLSNPTMPLPPEYPAEKVLFTVTFFYNMDPRSQP